MASASKTENYSTRMVESPCVKQVFAPPRERGEQKQGQSFEGWGCQRQCRLAGRRLS